jgi:hypothetical protein
MRSSPLPINIAIRCGTIKGWRGFVWMLKIILPVSLATFLLDFSGWLHRLDGILEPMMGVIHLPAMAALPLLVGLLTSIYGAIAAMSVLPFTIEQMTLMAIFLLVAHSLIQEGMVQHRSGCPAWMATIVRLTAAVLTVCVVGWVVGPDTAQSHLSDTTAIAPINPFWRALGKWAAEMAVLSLKILLIITSLMIVMEILKQFHLTDRMIRVTEPLMGVIGLDREVGMLWLTAAIFGITYGGAVIVEEAEERRLSSEKLKTLHISIGINHAIIEDPALFLPLGIHPFWLWIPRLVTAFVFTAIYRMWRWTKTRHRAMTVNTVPSDG